MSSRITGAIDLVPLPSPSGIAIDLSAGEGIASRALQERGWRVISTEFHPGTRGWVSADLTWNFPFRDQRADLVVMLEVIEHLPDIAHALSEISRILKPGGLALISTPNRLNLTSRVHYLLSGFYKGRRSPLPYSYRIDDGRNWHVMGLNDLHWMAHSFDLHVEAIGKSRRKLRSWLYLPVLYLPVLLFSWMLYGRGAKDPAQSRINRQLYRLMISPSLLLDENLILRLRKTRSESSAD